MWYDVVYGVVEVVVQCGIGNDCESVVEVGDVVGF